MSTSYAQHAHPQSGGGKMKTPEASANVDAPIRLTMEELHRHGGIPPGWRFRLPKGDPASGRGAFIKQECFACHHVAGEKFAKRDRKPTEKGPDLTGMGAHHPAEFFFESILHPNRVITADPGYTGEDGLSIMPSYSHLLTLEEAVDLTAYIKSLKGGGRHGHHGETMKHDMKKKPHGEASHGSAGRAAASRTKNTGTRNSPPPKSH
ncbi:c-type cytochrome [Nitrospinota bacterium]